MKIVLLILLLLVVVLAAGCAYLARFVAYPKMTDHAHAMEIERKAGHLGDWEQLPKEPFTVTAADGYVLHGVKVPGGDRAVILSHGYSYNDLGGLKYVPLFRKMGFTVYLYDNRGHGDNDPAPCTMGYRESGDLISVIRHVRDEVGETAMVGLHGESLGASLSVMALAEHPPVDFLVADCGYGDLTELLQVHIHKMFHLPGWLVNAAGCMSRLMYGYAFRQVKPTACMAQIQTPVCFIHGDSDHFTDCRHSVAMKDAAVGYAELHLIPKADHAASIDTDPQAYEEIVEHFVNHVTESLSH